jgi:hypothetical protein
VTGWLNHEPESGGRSELAERTAGGVESILITTLASVTPVSGEPVQAVQDEVVPFVSLWNVLTGTHVPGATSVALGADHRTVTGPRYHPSQETGSGEHSTNTGVGDAWAFAANRLASTTPNTGATLEIVHAGILGQDQCV